MGDKLNYFPQETVVTVMLTVGVCYYISCQRQQSSTKGSVSELSSALNEILTVQEMSTFQQTDTLIWTMN